MISIKVQKLSVILIGNIHMDPFEIHTDMFCA